MDAKEFREKAIIHMATTNTRLENIDGWMGKLDRKVDDINVNGCAKGSEMERRVDKFENAPKRQALGGGALAGGGIAASIVGIVKALEFIFSGK